MWKVNESETRVLSSRLDNTLVSDSFTFHIRVTQTGENNHSAQEAALARNTNRLFAGWFN